MTLRERIAEATHDGIEAYLADRIDGYAPKPFVGAFPADRDVRFAEADAILTLPELRALAAGELFRRCEECDGTGRTLGDDERGHEAWVDCHECEKRGFVPVALDGVTPDGEG